MAQVQMRNAKTEKEEKRASLVWKRRPGVEVRPIGQPTARLPSKKTRSHHSKATAAQSTPWHEVRSTTLQINNRLIDDINTKNLLAAK